MLDYVIYAFYVDEKFAIKNKAKDLLWNVFGKELNTRLSKREFRTKEFYENDNEDELKARREKLLEKKKNIKEKAKKVVIEGIDDVDETDIKIIEFYKQNTFKDIDETDLSKQAKKVLKVLIMLNLILKNYNRPLLIDQSSKKTTTRATISKFTGINGMKIDECLKELMDRKFIGLEMKKDKITLECTINFKISNTGNSVKLKDSGSVYKHIK